MTDISNKGPNEYLPLTPAVLHIMLALMDGEMHGYAIMRDVRETTDGRMILGPGTLYGAIKRLLNEALIAESEERPDPLLDDSRRRYYELTEKGRRVLAGEVDRLDRLVELARRKELIDKTTSVPGKIP